MSKYIYTTPPDDFKLVMSIEELKEGAVSNACWFDWSGIPKSEEHKKAISIANSKPKTGKALEACKANARLGAEARRGQKDSLEVRRKRASSLSKTLTGLEQPNRRKKYKIDNKIYVGMKSIIEEFNVTRQTIYNRIKSDEWNWHYADSN